MAGEYLLAATGTDDDDDLDVGFDVDQAMPWLLPAHILDEACGFPTIIDHRHTNDCYYSSKGRGQRGRGNHNHDQHHYHVKLIGDSAHPITTLPVSNIKPRTTKPNRHHHHHHRHPRQVNNYNNINGGGMRAIFLEKSGNKSSTPRGTGVFLPRQAGTSDFQSSSQNPPCSPVLLPSRVVQALNLNIHQLGLQISPQKIIKNNHRDGGGGGGGSSSPSFSSSSSLSSDQDTNKLLIQEENPNLLSQESSDNYHVKKMMMTSSSPEIFLPKEWSY